MRERTEQEEKRRVRNWIIGLVTGAAMWAGLIAIGLTLFGCATAPASDPRADVLRQAVREGRAAYADHCLPHVGKPSYERIRRDCDSLLETNAILTRRAVWLGAQRANGLTAGGSALVGAAAGMRGEFGYYGNANAFTPHPFEPAFLPPGNPWVVTPQSIMGGNGTTYSTTPSGFSGSDGSAVIFDGFK